MAIVKVDPFRELTAMQDRMARLFGDVYLRDEDTGFRGTWTPAVDIFATHAGQFSLQHEIVLLGLEDVDRRCPAAAETGVLVTQVDVAKQPRHTVLHRCQLTERVNFDDCHFRFLLCRRA